LPVCCGFIRAANFGNPNGIESSSPTLRQRRYVGLRIEQTHNRNAVVANVARWTGGNCGRLQRPATALRL